MEMDRSSRDVNQSLVPRSGQIDGPSCSNCIVCQANTSSSCSAPLQMTTLPEASWQNVEAVGPLPSGEHLLVMIDEHSHFPVVEVVH